MKTTIISAIPALALALHPTSSTAEVLNGSNNNEILIQVNPGQLDQVSPALRPFSTDESLRNDTLNFLGGNDRLMLLRDDDLAGLGSGEANMGDGRDVVITSFNMEGTFNLGGGNDFFHCEGSVFGPSFNQILVLAGPGNDLIDVTTADSRYFGEDGNDIFVSDGADNAFDGGNGGDTYSAERAESAASIDLAAGTAFARFRQESDVLANIENVRGSAFSDTIFGTSGNNRIDGLGGNDSIDGDPGNDTISGGAGTNTLEGNAGIDTLVVQGTVETKSRLSPTGIRVTGAINGVAFIHNASGFEQVLDNGVLKSVAFFLGETTSNSVRQTVIAESPVEAAINGFLLGTTLLGTAVANTLNGTAGHDDIAGFGGNDTLNGNAGDDFIIGGDGNDTINGGVGIDTLAGGAGNDIFVFNTALAGNADRIADYNVAQDTIRIKSSLVGNLPAGALATNRFKILAERAVIDLDDRVLYNTSNGHLTFDRNGGEAGGSVLIATLPANLAMVAREIVIIP